MPAMTRNVNLVSLGCTKQVQRGARVTVARQENIHPLRLLLALTAKPADSRRAQTARSALSATPEATKVKRGRRNAFSVCPGKPTLSRVGRPVKAAPTALQGSSKTGTAWPSARIAFWELPRPRKAWTPPAPSASQDATKITQVLLTAKTA